MNNHYHKIWHIFRGLLFLSLVVWFVYSVRTILIPFFLGFLIAYVLHPLVDLLEKRKLPRALAISVIYVFFAAIAAVVVFYALPVILRDLNNLVEVIPHYTATIQNMVIEFQLSYSRVPIPDGIREVSDGVINRFEQTSLSIIRGIVSGIIILLSQTFNIVLAPLLSFYFLMDYNEMGNKILCLIPTRYRQGLIVIAHEVDAVIKKVIRGNLLVATLVAILATVGMMIIGMDFPLLIGILVGITNFIPYFGAFISTVPIVLLALLKSKWLALYVFGVMVFIQQIEGNIISPKILGEYIGLHPLVIIFALLAGGTLWGFVGLLLAVPIAAILKVLFKHAYLHLI
ncbi:MAG: AI-2E family transporter [Firmicutes bacterium HGW-Firmicutes-12]|jgi:predicted PurR-regulated permease PerM|nr:MAG: AI-2E family transporter [Firmicutes bacterium HGW-Firmicutes-12]